MVECAIKLRAGFIWPRSGTAWLAWLWGALLAMLVLGRVLVLGSWGASVYTRLTLGGLFALLSTQPGGSKIFKNTQCGASGWEVFCLCVSLFGVGGGRCWVGQAKQGACSRRWFLCLPGPPWTRMRGKKKELARARPRDWMMPSWASSCVVGGVLLTVSRS